MDKSKNTQGYSKVLMSLIGDFYDFQTAKYLHQYQDKVNYAKRQDKLVHIFRVELS